MEEERIKGKNYTVGVLVLHTAVLFWINSFSFGVSILTIWGFIAIAVTGKHYRDTVEKRYLQIWAAIHLAISTYGIFGMIQLSFSGYSLIQAGLFQLIIFITPPVAIMYFASIERT